MGKKQFSLEWINMTNIFSKTVFLFENKKTFWNTFKCRSNHRKSFNMTHGWRYQTFICGSWFCVENKKNNSRINNCFICRVRIHYDLETLVNLLTSVRMQSFCSVVAFNSCSFFATWFFSVFASLSWSVAAFSRSDQNHHSWKQLEKMKKILAAQILEKQTVKPYRQNEDWKAKREVKASSQYQKKAQKYETKNSLLMSICLLWIFKHFSLFL